jgi:signal transduction histidine kinase/ActR/RegA family two-component response regulator
MPPVSESGPQDALIGRILECVKELLPLQDLDSLLRRGVELARQKLGVERCSLWLLDFDGVTLRGTYGTDMQGETTDEHGSHFKVAELENDLPRPLAELDGWTVKTNGKRISWTEFGEQDNGEGWNSVIPVHGPDGQVGCLFQDAAITNRPLDPHQHDLMTVYCSLLGQIAGRRLAESRESILSSGLEAVLAAADELLADQPIDTLYKRLVELARERLGIVRAGLFITDDGSTTKFRGTWGTDMDGTTSDEHKAVMDLEKGDGFVEHGTVFKHTRRWSAFQPYPLSWYEADGTKIEVEDCWHASLRLMAGERLLGMLFVDPGRSRTPLDTRKLDLVATYCALAARIIDRRRAQEALRKTDTERLDSLGVLAGGLAHDFNNLLASILGGVELMLDAPEMPADRRMAKLRDARDACLRGKSLAGQLLTFSRGGTPVRKPISTLAFLEETLRSSVGAHPMSWRLSHPEQPWNLLADQAQIGQVFQNLAVNSCHWQPEGGTLRVEIANRAVAPGEDPDLDPGMYLEIEIEDGGPGIPESLRRKIFDPYFSTRAGGSGLGLATCRSIVSRHAGTIECLPSSRGARFRLLLPATDASPELLSSPQELSIDLSGKRILVMDDEPVLRELLREMLVSRNAEVVAVEDGKRAHAAWIEALSIQRPFHVGILDITIVDGMGGIETARQIHLTDPDARLIVCSGYSNDPLLAETDHLDFVGVLAKPFRIAELLEIVSKSIAGCEISNHS